MAKKDSGAPIKGDDAGNLLKAGYAANEIAEAKKLYASEMKERPDVMGNLTFSEFLFEQASLAYVLDNITEE